MVTAFKISQSLTRSVLSAGLLSAALSISPAIAGDDGGAVRLIGTVAIPATLKPLHGFDISWIDAQTQRYYLADRSNAAIDVVDAKTGTFLKAILGGFAGIAFNANGTANNAASGPHGVVTAGRWLFATDAAGRVVSIDLNTDTVVSTVFTSIAPGTLRADELAYDPVGGTLLVVNNADTPPFATLIKVNKSTGVLTLGQRITFGTGVGQAGINASNGAEQPVWDEQSKKFYLSIPEVCPVGGPLCGGNDPNGAVVRISPSSTGGLEAVYPVKYCQPAGLTLGPKQDLLIGCSVVFDTVGNVWSAADPNTAAPISVIMDAKNGSIDSVVAGVSGSDEVWFNPGDGRYYLAARNQPGGPVLGVIDAKKQKLVQVVPTLNVGAKPFFFPAGTAHSVAVNPHNNHVFVPLAANNVFPNCLNGCIAVYGSPEHD